MLSKLYSLEQKVIEHKYNSQDCIGSVFMFHQVNNNLNIWQESSCSITEDSFDYFIYSLLETSTFKPINEVVDESFFQSSEYSKKRCFLTFDDAYDDVFNNCFPLMKKEGIPFTIFVSCNYIDSQGYLSTDMINEMLESGLCTLGSHTISHSLLRYMNNTDVSFEMKESKNLLSRKFNLNVDIMAYPYGSVYACSKQNILDAERAGYKYAFSTLNCHLTKENIKDIFFLPRINVNEENHKRILRRYHAVF